MTPHLSENCTCICFAGLLSGAFTAGSLLECTDMSQLCGAVIALQDSAVPANQRASASQLGQHEEAD
jgi:hypothetical protein